MVDDDGLEARLQALKDLYIEGLPDKQKELNDAIERVKWAADDEALTDALRQLRAIAHKLAGSGATYGFGDLSFAARALENVCDPYIDKRASQGEFPKEEFADRSHDLIAEFEKAQADGASNGRIEPCAPATPIIYSADNTKVLVAESEPEIATQLEADLSTFGLDVRTVTQTAELENVFTGFDPDVLLIDFDFPDQPQNGAQVLSDIRAKGLVDCPVVFYADRSDIEARLAAVRAGCQAFLVKPASAPQLIEVIDHVISHEDPEPYRILIVDDDLSTASYSNVILSGHNMIVDVLTDPMKVLETLNDFAPELILMDLYMPGCSGMELAEVIRQQEAFAGIPIVFLSGEADREKQIRAMNAGGDDFLTKPITADRLVAAVRVRVQRFRALRGQMVSDSLTGLFNHTTTREFLEKELGRAERENSMVCFLMLDIDHFKRVNDTYGHPVGDKVILSLARLLKQRLRGSDIIGRLGGEEFGVILPSTPVNDAQTIAEEIRTSFSGVTFEADNAEFNCTISIGLATFPDYTSMPDLIEAADEALYAAKNGGRNQVKLASKPE